MYALAGLLVDQHGVPLAERAAAAVLAAEPDRGALQQERAEGQRSRRTPSRPSRGDSIALTRAAKIRSSLGLTWKPGGDGRRRLGDRA